jgi:hypothetical protein
MTHVSSQFSVLSYQLSVIRVWLQRRQWQPQLPPPQVGRDGMPQLSARAVDAPTIPNLDNSRERFSPWHDGHSAFRLAVTKVSNDLSQSRHTYS